MTRGLGSFEVVEVGSAAELERWLEANCEREAGVWLATFKKHVPARYVSKEVIAEIALCFGWVDGQPKALDADRTLRFFSRRRPDSVWSPRNKERVLLLEREGRLRPSGIAVVEAARANGMWSYMDDVHALVRPDDLVRALEGEFGAREGFDSFAPSAQRLILGWIKQARTPATRAERIARTATLAAKGLKAYGS